MVVEGVEEGGGGREETRTQEQIAGYSLRL